MAIPIVSGATTDQLTVTTKKAALITPIEPAYGSLGGGFIVSGGTTAVVAAALAANTTLMAARMAAASSRKFYITKLRLVYTVVTAFAAAAVPGQLAWQKFSAATPTGGTARTATRKNSSEGSTPDLNDIRDSNAALTVTSVTFADLPAIFDMPAFTVSGSFAEFLLEFDDVFNQPLVLQAGEGLCLRSQTAFGATGTWMYSYIMQGYEK